MTWYLRESDSSLSTITSLNHIYSGVICWGFIIKEFLIQPSLIPHSSLLYLPVSACSRSAERARKHHARFTLILRRGGWLSLYFHPSRCYYLTRASECRSRSCDTLFMSRPKQTFPQTANYRLISILVGSARALSTLLPPLILHSWLHSELPGPPGAPVHHLYLHSCTLDVGREHEVDCRDLLGDAQPALTTCVWRDSLPALRLFIGFSSFFSPSLCFDPFIKIPSSNILVQMLQIRWRFRGEQPPAAVQINDISQRGKSRSGSISSRVDNW